MIRLSYCLLLLNSCISTDARLIMKDEKACQCPFDEYEYDIECCEGGMWHKYKKDAVKK